MTTPATAELIERLSELAEKAMPDMYWWESGVPADAGTKMLFIAACDPQAILALCAAAKLGLDAKENAK